MRLDAGGYVGNTATGALIEGSPNGITIIDGPGTVNNAGTISGSNYGVWLAVGGTVIDSGTIISGGGSHYAVYFTGTVGGSNLLVLDPGYKLIGTAHGCTRILTPEGEVALAEIYARILARAYCAAALSAPSGGSMPRARL